MATSTLGSGTLVLAGTTSGTTTVTATAVAGTTTLTLPAATDTLVGKATTDTLTNKTLTTPTISSLSSAAATALTLQSAGTTAITVDTSQKVGIGTASPSAPLHVQAITGGVAMRFTGRASPNDSYSDISFYNNANTTQAAGIGAATSGLFLATALASPITFTTNNAEAARIDSSGNLLVGTTSGTNARIYLVADATSVTPFILNNTASGAGANSIIIFRRNGTTTGSVDNTGTTTSYVTSSDYRLKNTIAPITGALAKVAQLKPVTYKWNLDGSDAEGFIAHELAEVCPQAVSGAKDAVDADGNIKPQGIDTSFLVATLTAAIQELNAKFEAYKATHP